MKKKLLDYFEYYKNTPSDINEHFETFRKYAHECDTIIEMGVRGITSTWSFIMGEPKKLVSIDFQHPEIFGGDLNEVYRICNEMGIDYEFRLQNTLECEIESCDLLFIDTWHDFLQLKSELFRHHKSVNKYIILHDTNSYGFKDEDLYSNYDEGRNESNLPKGLIAAVYEFLLHNRNWFIFERFSNNNGITILKKNDSYFL
jgi:hypothetical protein